MQMIRKHEKELAWRAGMFTLLVHTLLFLVLVFSFHWKSVAPMQITSVELWDSLPHQTVKQAEPTPEPAPTPPPVEPVVQQKPEPKAEPEPVVKAEIQLKKAEPKKTELKKKEPKSSKNTKEQPKPDEQEADDLKKLQESLLEEETQVKRQEKPKTAQPIVYEVKAPVSVQGSTVDKSEVAKYTALIIARIKQHVNTAICGNTKSELQFSLAIMPTGYVNGKPNLVSSNASPACNDAVERAILQAQPLPLPEQPDLYNQFRELKLKFKPNDG